MVLDHGPVVRRKDLGVTEPVTVESHLARKNSRRHIQVLLGGFILAAVAEGAVVGLIVGQPYLAMVIAVAFAVVYFVLAREFGDTWIARALRAEPTAGPRVTRLAAAEAQNAGIPAPRVLIASGADPNATSFALRRRWIVATEGAESLDELALEGLVAHEVVHLRDGDAAVAALYLVLAGAPDLVLRRAGVLTLLSVPLWPAAFVLRLLRKVAVPADRELRADIAAAMLTRYPPGIVSALEVAGGATTGVRAFDPFWFVARAGGRPEAERRAALIAEM